MVCHTQWPIRSFLKSKSLPIVKKSEMLDFFFSRRIFRHNWPEILPGVGNTAGRSGVVNSWWVRPVLAANQWRPCPRVLSPTTTLHHDGCSGPCSRVPAQVGHILISNIYEGEVKNWLKNCYVEVSFRQTFIDACVACTLRTFQMYTYIIPELFQNTLHVKYFDTSHVCKIGYSLSKYRTEHYLYLASLNLNWKSAHTV